MFVTGCKPTAAADWVEAEAVRLPVQVSSASPGPASSLACGDVDPGLGGDARLFGTSASRDSQRAGLGRVAYGAGRLGRWLDAGTMGSGR